MSSQAQCEASPRSGADRLNARDDIGHYMRYVYPTFGGSLAIVQCCQRSSDSRLCPSTPDIWLAQPYAASLATFMVSSWFAPHYRALQPGRCRRFIGTPLASKNIKTRTDISIRPAVEGAR